LAKVIEHYLAALAGAARQFFAETTRRRVSDARKSTVIGPKNEECRENSRGICGSATSRRRSSILIVHILADAATESGQKYA